MSIPIFHEALRRYGVMTFVLPFLLRLLETANTNNSDAFPFHLCIAGNGNQEKAFALLDWGRTLTGCVDPGSHGAWAMGYACELVRTVT